MKKNQKKPQSKIKRSNLAPAWPGAFGIYNESKKAVMINIKTIIFCYLIAFAISIVVDVFFEETATNLITSLAGLVLAPIFAVTFLYGSRGTDINLSEAFERIRPNLSNLVITQVLTGIINALMLLIPVIFVSMSIFTWGLLNQSAQNPAIVIAALIFAIALCIPFLIVAPRLSLALYYGVDKNASFSDAIKHSWNNTKNHIGKFYGILGVSLLIALLMITIIGMPVAIYLAVMYSAAQAILYIFIDNEKYQPISA